MSPMPVRAAISSSRSMALFTRASTDVRRLLMAATLKRGRSSQERRSRPPMAVFVLSRTHSRLPRFSLSRMVAVSSRLRRAVRSSSMNRPSS